MPPASRKTRSQNAYRLARRATALCHPFDTPAAPPAGPDAASTSAPQAVPTASSCAPTRRSSPAPLSARPPERQSVSRHSCSDLPRGADPRFVAPFAVVAQSAAERPMRRSLSAHQGALTSPTRGIERAAALPDGQRRAAEGSGLVRVRRAIPHPRPTRTHPAAEALRSHLLTGSSEARARASAGLPAARARPWGRECFGGTPWSLRRMEGWMVGGRRAQVDARQ